MVAGAGQRGAAVRDGHVVFFPSDRDSTPGAQNVQNLFGAMEWSDDGGHHDSWLKDKDKLVRDAPE